MTRFRWMLAFASCALTLGPGCTDPAPAPTDAAPTDVAPTDVAPTDATDVTDASDALDVSDARDAADIRDVTDVFVPRDVPDVPDVTDVTDASDATPMGLLAPLPSACRVVFEDAAALCRTTPCAVTANVALQCPGNGFGLAVAAGTARASVSYTENQGGFHPMYASLDLAARAGTVEQVPSGNWPARVLSTRGGGAYVAAYSADASDRDALAVLTRESGGWRRVMIEGGRYVPIAVGDGAHHADGRESFVYSRGEGDASSIMAATRAADGTWTTSQLAGGPVFGRFAIDTAPDGTGDIILARWRFGVPTAMARTLLIGAGTTEPRAAYVQSPGTSEAFNHVTVVSRAGGSPVAAIGLDDGVHALLPGATAYTDTLVANTARGHDTTCPGEGGSPPVSCGTTRMCTAHGTYGGFGSHGLARTADGRVWLVYAQQYVDRDYRVTYSAPMGPGCFASSTVLADRTRTELVVVEVGATLTERARLVMNDGASTSDLDVDAAGSSLQIARLGEPLQPSDPPVLRFVAVDTATLR